MARVPDGVAVITRVVLACALVAGALAIGGAPATRATDGPPVAADAELAPWTGGVSLYRSGTFTTQKTWMWCTAAGIQITRNIVLGEQDHSAAAQRRYFEWMRPRNRYSIPVSAGVDPAAWEAGMRRFVDDRYRLTSSATFDGALRLAVTRIRLTGLPAAIAVKDGSHAWLLTGFTASADPAATTDFTVTGVRVVGPLYGLQSRNGYDMKPNTKLSVSQLRRFFTPFHYGPLPMIWEGRYVSVQPVPLAQAPTGASPASAVPEPVAAPDLPPGLPPAGAIVALGVGAGAGPSPDDATGADPASSIPRSGDGPRPTRPPPEQSAGVGAATEPLARSLADSGEASGSVVGLGSIALVALAVAAALGIGTRAALARRGR